MEENRTSVKNLTLEELAKELQMDTDDPAEKLMRLQTLLFQIASS